MYILGISCHYHDAAACLIKDGLIIAAAEEERFTRKKHDHSFPQKAIEYCLSEAGIKVAELSSVIFYEKPLLKFERILELCVRYWPLSFMQFQKAIPVWFKEKFWVAPQIKEILNYDGPIYFSSHHLSHAASTFFVSPFESAAILTVDGVGEWTTCSIAHGRKNDIKIIKEIQFPHSLGLFYSAITGFLGFKVNSAEYKVMGAAPYGRPLYYEQMKELISWRSDGSFKINLKYFRYQWGLKMFSPRKISRLFGVNQRGPYDELTQAHFDIAASLQKVTDEIMVLLAKEALRVTGEKKLCLAGGVALNCVANGKILDQVLEADDIFIQPASGDAGGALGAAYVAWHMIEGQKERTTLQKVYLGPSYDNDVIEGFLKDIKVPFKEYSEEELIEKVVQDMISQKVVGWFQGRMEFGPRALGNRSIIADPRQAENRDRVNLRIKFRESFRPFAPSIISEKLFDYFDIKQDSPFMLLVGMIKESKNKSTPATTHVDGSARIQTVSSNQNPRYYKLLQFFEQKTGVPIIINTSFNVRGEPIVCSPKDAVECFLTTDMDILALGDYIIDKIDLNKVKYKYVSKLDRKFGDD